ncbi:MAG TPA: hypothetical protein VGK30_15765 [Candidatus Binatia bacterium]|jgi:hypothetical protein
MEVDVIRAQHAGLRHALAALLSLTDAPAARVARAAAAMERAFAAGVPVWAELEVATIRRLAPAATALDTAQLAALATAFLDLYTVGCREYWTA